MMREGDDSESEDGDDTDLVICKRLNECGHGEFPLIGFAALGKNG
jgi:hypothetical protein